MTKVNMQKDNSSMVPFPGQYEYIVFDVDIYFAGAWQLLAS